MKTLLLILCLSSVGLAQEPQSSEKAKIYIFQTPHARMLKRAAPPVFCDGKLLAELDGGRYFVLNLDGGHYGFHSKNKTNGGVELEVKPGETYYLRVEMEHTGYFLKFSGISLTPPEQGAFTVRQLRPISSKYVKDPRVDQNQTEEGSK